MNKNISTQLQSTYKIALYSSLSLLISTPLIIFGRNIATLIIIGAILAIPAFYAAVIMWLHYARLIMCNKILSLITDKEMRDIKNQKINNPYRFSNTNKRYYTYDYYLRKTFGGKCAKIPIDAGFTCPNIDGTRGHGGCIYCSDRGSGDFAQPAEMPITEQVCRVIEGETTAKAALGELMNRPIKNEQDSNWLKEE